jgi:hypothetical protein
MEKIWQPLENIHDNVTKGSRKLMNHCSLFTHSALNARKSEPGISELLAFYDPIHQAYRGLYVPWKSSEGTYHGSTRALELLWEELPKSVKKWDIKIMDIYDDTTERYEELLPGGRTAFSRLEYDEREAALAAFIVAIGDDANEVMRVIKTQATTLDSRIVTARSLQAGKKSKMDDLADRTELARKDCADGLYAVQAGLMRLYYQNPQLVEGFFDVEAYRSTKPEEDEPEGGLVLTVAPGQTIEAGISFDAATRILFLNHGEVPVGLFTSGETPVVPPNPLMLPAGEEIEVAIADLGPAGSRYLYIQNTSTELPAAVELITIEAE